MNKKTIFILGVVLIAVLVVLGVVFFSPPKVMGAPYAVYVRSLLPERSNLYDLGTSTKIWNTILVNTITGSTTVMAGNILADTFNASSTVASSTFGNGLNITKGCFSVKGTCLVAGGVSSVDMTVPLGLAVSGNPITTSGTLALTYASGYQGLTSYASSTWDNKWDLASSTGLIHANTLLGFNGSQIISTGTPQLTVGWVNATTTATSTYTGGIHMNTADIDDVLTIKRICFDTGQCMSAPNVTGSLVTLFHHNTAAGDIALYEALFTYPPTGTETDESCSADADISGGYCDIDSYVSTTTDITFTTIPTGTWDFRKFVYVDSTAGNSKIESNVYKRNSAGTETFLFQATSTDIDSTAVILREYSSSQSAFILDPTDRIVIKIKGWTDQTNPKVIHIVYGSTNRYTRVITPATIESQGFTKYFHEELITGLWRFNNTGTTTYSGGIETPMLGASIVVATSTTKGSYLTYASSTAFTATNLFGGTLVLTNALGEAYGGTASTTFGTAFYNHFNASATSTKVLTRSFQFTISTSTMGTTTNYKAFRVPVNFTITEVSGFCLGGTSTLMIDQRSAARPKVAGTDIFDDAFEVGDYVSTTTFDVTAITAGQWINLDVDGYFQESPKDCQLNIKGTATN